MELRKIAWNVGNMGHLQIVKTQLYKVQATTAVPCYPEHSIRFLCSKADIDAHVTEFSNITVEVSTSGFFRIHAKSINREDRAGSQRMPPPRD